MNYLTLEQIVRANEKDIELKDGDTVVGMVRIRAVQPELVIQIFDRHGEKLPEKGAELKLTPKENLEYVNEVIAAGLVDPATPKEQAPTLGRFRFMVFSDILAFSGLAAKDEAAEETFRPDSPEPAGAVSGDAPK